MVIKIGVLGLQGGFALHHFILQKIGVQSVKVKKPLDLDGIDGLVIPGGESTTMSKLIETFKFMTSQFEDVSYFGSFFLPHDTTIIRHIQTNIIFLNIIISFCNLISSS